MRGHPSAGPEASALNVTCLDDCKSLWTKSVSIKNVMNSNRQSPDSIKQRSAENSMLVM